MTEPPLPPLLVAACGGGPDRGSELAPVATAIPEVAGQVFDGMVDISPRRPSLDDGFYPVTWSPL